MKKMISIILLLLCIFTLSACGDTDKPVQSVSGDHSHTFGEWTTVNSATCTEGKEEERSCACGEKETKSTEAAGHIEVVDKAVAATCAKEGKTEGKHCSVCNEVLVAQKVVAKLRHTEVVDAAVTATCAKEGKTQGKHCSVCNEVLVAQQSIEKLEHTEVKIPRVEPTCITTGKTGGKYCSVCNEVIKAQKELETSEHTFGEWSIVKYATKTEEGTRQHTCTVCNTTITDVIDKREYNSAFGSAYKFSETTVIVSIFANNDSYKWDLDSPLDLEVKELMYTHLINACDWLEIQGEDYGVDTKFICDWKANPDLYYTCTVKGSGSGFDREFIKENINSEELLQKHNAQNILYFVYYDVPDTITTRSSCASKAPNRGGSGIELVTILDRMQYEEGKYIYTPAATFAHEILHAFGAPDLYAHSSRVPKEYVDYLTSIKSSDIMYTVNFGQSVSVFFSPLCAYYVGLIDTCEDVEKWGLAKSYYLIPESEYVY